MTRRMRWLLVLTLLGAGAVSQLALWRHVAADGPATPPMLVKPLAELPLAIAGWIGQEQAIEDPRALTLGDERLRRVYRSARGNATAEVWMLYSGVGADRGHHPEVCMAVAGRPEEVTGRAAIPVPGHPAPVQQFRFGSGGQRQLVYYWHYTLAAADDREGDALQRIYRRLRWRPASVTIQVYVPELSSEDGSRAQEFVRLLDQSFQAHLPADAVRGSQRTPVTVVAR